MSGAIIRNLARDVLAVRYCAAKSYRCLNGHLGSLHDNSGENVETRNQRLRMLW